MDSQFWLAAGQVVGVIGGLGLLTLMFYVGLSWGEVKSTVTTTSASVVHIETRVNEFAPRIQRIEQTLHGPDGNNGLYSDVRQIREQLREAPGTPRRRRTDDRKRRGMA